MCVLFCYEEEEEESSAKMVCVFYYPTKKDPVPNLQTMDLSRSPSISSEGWYRMNSVLKKLPVDDLI